MKLAAIDIGSNAARLQITKVLFDGPEVIFKKLEYVRFPLRLGHDVFTVKHIGLERENNFVKLLHAYKLLMELHQVQDYMACATSAMREARNGQQIAERIQSELGMKIQIIDGNKEAELINRVVVVSLDERPYIHIDVGGGSTELNFYNNRSKTASHSFRMGSVRQLEHTDSPLVWRRMQEWVQAHTPAGGSAPLTAIGTGGNIGKLYDLARLRNGSLLSANDIARLKDHISGLSFEERVNKLRLNPDRADVIVPAAQIYLSVMQWAGAAHIQVPDVGLKDGIIQLLYERNRK